MQHSLNEIHHGLTLLRDGLFSLLRTMERIERKVDHMTKTQDAAAASLVNITNAGVAVQTMIANFIKRIEDKTDDPAVLAELKAIDDQSAAIAASALQNTQADPGTNPDAPPLPAPGTPTPAATV